MNCVYRFVDLEDNTVKYIGIVFGENRTLKQRTFEHARYDDWCKEGSWKVEFFDVNSRSEAESLEGHLISLYNTGDFYNKSKSRWGVNSFFFGLQFRWEEYCRVFNGEVQITGDLSIPFIRIEIGQWNLNGALSLDMREHVIYGRRNDDGTICLNDGSIIKDRDVGKIFCSKNQLRGFNRETSMFICDRVPRKPKLQNIEIVSYCLDSSDLKVVKTLMLDAAISAESKDRDMREQRYKSAFLSYQSTINTINRLNAIRANI